MTRNGNNFGYGLGRSTGRGMCGRGTGQGWRDGTGPWPEPGFSGGFGRCNGQGQRRCRFEENDGRTGFSGFTGFAGFNRIGAHPFAAALARVEAAIEDLKRQINDLRQKP